MGCCDEQQPKEGQVDSCCSVKKNEDSGCCTSKVVKPDNCCGDATCSPEPTSIQVKAVETTDCCSAQESESKTKCSKTSIPKASNKKSCCSNDDKPSRMLYSSDVDMFIALTNNTFQDAVRHQRQWRPLHAARRRKQVRSSS